MNATVVMSADSATLLEVNPPHLVMVDSAPAEVAEVDVAMGVEEEEETMEPIPTSAADLNLEFAMLSSEVNASAEIVAATVMPPLEGVVVVRLPMEAQEEAQEEEEDMLVPVVDTAVAPVPVVFASHSSVVIATRVMAAATVTTPVLAPLALKVFATPSSAMNASAVTHADTLTAKLLMPVLLRTKVDLRFFCF